mmetsp:Transcript_73678/g.173053  ORF Transcript_73678/g.173053 Transcript_73678/m.173053 type:complete len:195 (-) Transcript_73678:91-675(-)
MQTPDFATMTIYIKGCTAENTTVEVTENSIAFDRTLGPSDSWQLHIDLARAVIPAESKTNFLSTKVEFKLKKASSGKWPAFEAADEQPLIEEDLEAVKKKRDLYPSSKAQKKNWDQLAEEIAADTKPEGEEALNAFFQELYGKSSEETRRAMNKSFQESGGTVLSTNWGEVGTKKVEGTPPDGLEMKKWSDLGK